MKRARFVTGHRTTVYTVPSKKRKRRRRRSGPGPSKQPRTVADLIDHPADTAAKRARKLGNRPP
jgi:predicted exporter